MRLLVVCMLLLTSSVLQGQTVYRCTDKLGNPVFSTDPCGKDAQRVAIDPPPPTSAASAASSDARAISDSNEDSTCRRHAEALRPAGGIERRIAELEARKAAAQKKLNAPRRNIYLDAPRDEPALYQQIRDADSALDEERHINMPRQFEAEANYRRALSDCDRQKAQRARTAPARQ